PLAKKQVAIMALPQLNVQDLLHPLQHHDMGIGCSPGTYRINTEMSGLQRLPCGSMGSPNFLSTPSQSYTTLRIDSHCFFRSSSSSGSLSQAGYLVVQLVVHGGVSWVN